LLSLDPFLDIVQKQRKDHKTCPAYR